MSEEEATEGEKSRLNVLVALTTDYGGGVLIKAQNPE